MGKVCIVGCGALDIDMNARCFKADDATVSEGDWISIDGFTGEVILGQLETRPPEVLQVLLEKTMKPEESGSYRYYAEIMEWADKTRTLGVRTNADQPDQSSDAIAFGAEGIGLCRTEHMFFEGERIMTVREMILADDAAAREAALAKLLPMQRDDFAGIFRVMGERPVTVRTLDPPLHEFLPHDDVDTRETATALGIAEDVVKAKVDDLHESNPMLGHRGCRLGIAYPEITAMQVRAILEAACLVQKEGQAVHPEIMIPLVGTKKELEHQTAVVREVAEKVFAEQGVTVDYLVGTMIEIPRAALTADQIAEVAEFFSFGTNDLTQMTLGVSRDDAGKFLPLYTSEALEIWPADPFATLDQEGVGQLVEIGIEKGRSTRPQLKVGICGEQGGDPETVKFCHRAKMDYVSCSPFRLPVARLAAAQAAIEESGDLQLEK
jgi:pyruvate,orthophosphate dikinase